MQCKMPNNARAAIFAQALLIAVAVGCSDHLQTYPVSGKVQFSSGGAVHVGTVELKSREHKVHARGQIQPDGSFSLTTYQEDDGAIEGDHDCVVVQMVVAEAVDAHRPSTIGVVDRRFANYSTSGLAVQIEPTQLNEIVLVVDGILKKQPENHDHKN